MTEEFDLSKERKRIFEEELSGKIISAGRIYRKIKAQDKEFIRRIKEEVGYLYKDTFKIPVHTLEKAGRHSKTPEEMREICADGFRELLEEIDKLAGGKKK